MGWVWLVGWLVGQLLSRNACTGARASSAYVQQCCKVSKWGSSLLPYNLLLNPVAEVDLILTACAHSCVYVCVPAGWCGGCCSTTGCAPSAGPRSRPTGTARRPLQQSWPQQRLLPPAGALRQALLTARTAWFNRRQQGASWQVRRSDFGFRGCQRLSAVSQRLPCCSVMQFLNPHAMAAQPPYVCLSCALRFLPVVVR